jgi:hypothetical protein
MRPDAAQLRMRDQLSRAFNANSRLATISVTTSPAPNRHARSRNGRSVTPDIGASTTRLRRVRPSISSGAAKVGIVKCSSFKQVISLHYF